MPDRGATTAATTAAAATPAKNGSTAHSPLGPPSRVTTLPVNSPAEASSHQRPVSELPSIGSVAVAKPMNTTERAVRSAVGQNASRSASAIPGARNGSTGTRYRAPGLSPPKGPPNGEVRPLFQRK